MVSDTLPLVNKTQVLRFLAQKVEELDSQTDHCTDLHDFPRSPKTTPIDLLAVLKKKKKKLKKFQKPTGVDN